MLKTQLTDEQLQHVYAISQSVGLPWTLEQYYLDNGNAHSRYIVTPEGFLNFHHLFDTVEVMNVAVLPSCQNKGVGKRLLRTLVDYAKAHNVATCLLEVRHSNDVARRLYEQCQFKCVDTRKNYYTNPVEHAAIYIWENV